MSTPQKTGWPAPELAQDDHRGLFRWFASKPDARRLVREALPDLCLPSGACSHRCAQGDCEGSRKASCLALGLHRLVQVDEQDDALVTPETAESWTSYAVFFLIAIASGCTALAWIAFTN